MALVTSFLDIGLSGSFSSSSSGGSDVGCNGETNASPTRRFFRGVEGPGEGLLQITTVYVMFDFVHGIQLRHGTVGALVNIFVDIYQMARMVPLDFDADRRLVGEFVDVASGHPPSA
jgi:hypothetical protein